MIPILYAEFWFLKKKLIRMALVEFRCKCITYYATVREMILEHRPMTAPNKHYNRNLVFWEENLKPTSNTIFGIPSCSCGIFLWMLANNFYQYRLRPSSPTVCPGRPYNTHQQTWKIVVWLLSLSNGSNSGRYFPVDEKCHPMLWFLVEWDQSEHVIGLD